MIRNALALISKNLKKKTQLNNIINVIGKTAKLT